MDDVGGFGGADPESFGVRNLVLSVCDLKQHGESPAERLLGASACLGTRLYLRGGCTSCKVWEEVHLLELEQMKWSELPSTGQKPGPRYGHTMTADAQRGNYLLLFGGKVAADSPAAFHGGDLLAGGGGKTAEWTGGEEGRITTPPNLDVLDTGLPTGKVEAKSYVYTMETQTLIWTRYAEDMTKGRFLHSASAAGDLLLIWGGISGAGAILGDLLVFDIPTKSWSASPAQQGEVPCPRYGHKTVYTPAGHELLLFGGTMADADIWTLNLTNYAWSKMQIHGTPPLPRTFHSFDLIGQRAFVFGGKTESALTDLYVLDLADPSRRVWKRPLYEGQVNVRGHSAAVLHDKLIVFGGVRDKKDAREIVIEQKVSKKLFFLNVLAIKENAATGEGDFKFKLVTVGDSGVGKSCLLTRFVQDYYSDFHVSTIGVDFKTVVTMVKGKLVKLQLWDTAGQERFSVVTGNYYRNSDGFIFVYDATNRTSFEHVDAWLEQVQQHHDCGPSTMKILVGNKHDLKDQIQVPESEGMAKASKLGAIFMCTSAKTAANVDMAFLSAATNLVEMRKATNQGAKSVSSGGGAGGLMGGSSGGVALTAQSPGNAQSKCNCTGK